MIQWSIIWTFNRSYAIKLDRFIYILHKLHHIEFVPENFDDYTREIMGLTEECNDELPNYSCMAIPFTVGFSRMHYFQLTIKCKYPPN